MEENKAIQYNGGLNTDYNPSLQPEGTSRFVLNGVMQSEKGDIGFLGNEESNEKATSIPEGFNILNSTYIGDGETALFLVSNDELISEIGILNRKDEYVTSISDENSPASLKLNFKLSKNIQATYRVRQGCNKTIYFTDNYNEPRFYDFSNPQKFKNSNGDVDKNLFGLVKTYNIIPKYKNLKVLDTGGLLEPGSISIGIMLVDSNLNATNIIKTSKQVRIYNENYKGKEFSRITGSINSEVDYENFPTTTKALKVEVDNLDETYDFYRLVFIESNSGNGQITKIKVSNLIPILKKEYIHTGENYEFEITEEEVKIDNQYISRAKVIEQIDNLIILGNLESANINFCKLQKFASRIKTDAISREVILNSTTDPSNTKNPTLNFEGMIEYMPGEIYSFGIEYLFPFGIKSPVYHIPGKNPSLSSSTVFTQGDSSTFVHGMSNNNESLSVYTENEICEDNVQENLWGNDSEGNPLVGNKVRHHRFPTRKEAGIGFVEKVSVGESTALTKKLQINVTGITRATCTQEDIDIAACALLAEVEPFTFTIKYTVDGGPTVFENSFTIDPNNFSFVTPVDENKVQVSFSFFTDTIIGNTITVTEITEQNYTFALENVTAGPGTRGLTYTTAVVDSLDTSITSLYKTRLLGVRFSNISMPSLEDTNGLPVIGYNIVRQERTEEEKTVLDSAVMFPTLNFGKYIGSGLINPELNAFTEGRISKRVFSFISPEYLFNEREYNSVTSIETFGDFTPENVNYSKIRFNDVVDGTTYNSKRHKDGNDDGGTQDGFGFTTIVRDAVNKWEDAPTKEIISSDIEDIFYLSALDYKNILNETIEVTNVAGDNKIGCLELKNTTIHSSEYHKCPYVYLKRDLDENYINFRLDPYYYETDNNFEPTQDTCDIFAGDTYVSSMRYCNNMYWQTRPAKRAGKKSLWTIIAGVVLIVVGAILLYFSGGSSAFIIGAGIALIGAGALYTSAGIKQAQYNRAYRESYDKGLRYTLVDSFVSTFYIDNSSYFGTVGEPYTNDGPSDDEIQWISDCATDFWFETQVPIGLRNRMVSNLPCFLDSPGKNETGNRNPLIGWEFFDLWYENAITRHPVSELERFLRDKFLYFAEGRQDGRGYIGHPLGDYYKVNPDYFPIKGIKTNYHIPIEYECCSDCGEKFPQRWAWSQQSFQEELTDNYRVFLPNNYKDMDGETGEIFGIFKINNDLFIHTKEAFWQVPRNYQERVTDQIVSFIGSGSLFEVPPQKLIDDDKGNTLGLQYSFSTSKTPNGYFFPNVLQKNVNLFNKGFETISEIGCMQLFKDILPIQLEEEYYNVFEKEYPFRDAVSHPLGVGYISAYDSVKKRILLTKIDKKLHPSLMSEDNEFTFYNGSTYIFENLQDIIEQKAQNGFTFVGIVNNQAVFKKTLQETTIEYVTETQTTTTVLENEPQNDVVVKVMLPMGEYEIDSNVISNLIISTFSSWKTAFLAANPAITNLDIQFYGRDYMEYDYIPLTSPVTLAPDYGTFLERMASTGGVHINNTNVPGSNPAYSNNNKKIIYVDFSLNNYNAHGPNFFLNSPLSNPLLYGLTNFPELVALEASARGLCSKFLRGVLVPIIMKDEAFDSIYLDREGTLQNAAFCLAVLKNRNYTQPEALSLPDTDFISSPNNSRIKTKIQNSDPSLHIGLEAANYITYTNVTYLPIVRLDEGMVETGELEYNLETGFLTVEKLSEMLDDAFYSSETIVTTEEVQIPIEVTTYTDVYEYVDGELFEEEAVIEDRSFTMSYDLKYNFWISFHSYLPNHYITTPEKMFTWKKGNDGLWKHHTKGKYGSFYGVKYNFIAENIYYKSPMLNTTAEDIKLYLDTIKYNAENDEFYEVDNVFFNKIIFYNSKQCSGELTIKIKDNESEDYFWEQVQNKVGEVIADKNEKDWTINDIRDYRIDYQKPIWKTKGQNLQPQYFIDKVLDVSTIDQNKDWSEAELFRDKFLAVRLIFDNLAEVKLLMKYSNNTDTISLR